MTYQSAKIPLTLLLVSFPRPLFVLICSLDLVTFLLPSSLFQHLRPSVLSFHSSAFFNQLKNHQRYDDGWLHKLSQPLKLEREE